MKYLSFIAPVVHDDTKEFYNISVIRNQKEGYKLSLKPYSINDFVDITLKKENFSDMDAYTENVKSDFKSRLGV